MALSSLAALVSLCLVASHIDDVSTLTIAEGLKSLRELNYLKLLFLVANELSCIDHLGLAVSGMQKLKYLDLEVSGRPQMTSIAGFSSCLQSLSKMDSLVIDLKDCVQLTSIDGIGAGIRAMPSLRILRLSFRECNIFFASLSLWKPWKRQVLIPLRS